MDPAEGFFIVVALLIAATTSVLIFRPITSRLGNLLEAIALAKMKQAERGDDVSALLLAIDDVQQRLRRIEGRLEGLPPASREARGLPAPGSITEQELSAIAARLRGPHSDGHA